MFNTDVINYTITKFLISVILQFINLCKCFRRYFYCNKEWLLTCLEHMMLIGIDNKIKNCRMNFKLENYIV